MNNNNLLGKIYSDKYGIIEKINKYALKILGYNNSDDIIGLNISDLLPSPYREEWNDYITLHFSHNSKRITRIIEALHSSGVIIPIQIRLAKYTIDHDIRYITYLESYKKLKARVIINENGIINNINQHMTRIFGWKNHEFINQHIKMIMSIHDQNDNILKMFCCGKLSWIKARHKNGKIIPLALLMIEKDVNMYQITFYEENDCECLIILEYENNLNQCQIISASHSTQYIFGYKPKKLINCNINVLLPNFKKCIEENEDTFRCEAKTFDNHLFHVDVHINNIENHHYHSNYNHIISPQDGLITPFALNSESPTPPISYIISSKSESLSNNKNSSNMKRLLCSLVISPEGFLHGVELPQIIENWKITNCVAVGGFSRVFYGKNINDETPSAIKCFNKEELKTDGVESMIGIEIDIMKRLNLSMKEYQQLYDTDYDINAPSAHLHIPKFLDIFETTEHYFLCQEFIPGSSLQVQCLLNDTGHFDELTSRKYFISILNAIKFMHNRKVAHRDLKLNNIMFSTNTNDIVIIDYGLSIVIKDENEISEDYYGSIPYLPPEISKETKYYPLKADIWSLGVCLIIMLTGDDLVDMVEEVSNGHLNDYLELAGNFTPQLIDLLNKILIMEPKQRLSIDEILIHPWITTEKLEILSPPFIPTSPLSSPSYRA